MLLRSVLLLVLLLCHLLWRCMLRDLLLRSWFPCCYRLSAALWALRQLLALTPQEQAEVVLRLLQQRCQCSP
jgi:hypothetical protein